MDDQGRKLTAVDYFLVHPPIPQHGEKKSQRVDDRDSQAQFCNGSNQQSAKRRFRLAQNHE